MSVVWIINYHCTYRIPWLLPSPGKIRYCNMCISLHVGKYCSIGRYSTCRLARSLLAFYCNVIPGLWLYAFSFSHLTGIVFRFYLSAKSTQALIHILKSHFNYQNMYIFLLSPFSLDSNRFPVLSLGKKDTHIQALIFILKNHFNYQNMYIFSIKASFAVCFLLSHLTRIFVRFFHSAKSTHTYRYLFLKAQY